MNRTQLEHIIRAASRISDDAEIVVIGSQAVHAQEMKLPPIAYISEEADVYRRHFPERADDIDFAIGELSSFHETFGYYAHGVSPETAILPAGWEGRLIRLSNSNTDGATGFCLDVHDLVLSKYVARAAMETVWRPGGAWATFIGDDARAALRHEYARRDYQA